MSSEQASYVKRQGHRDAQEFAKALGIGGREFKSDPTAKKDVIDQNGYSYSVKSGKKKWQIFLYGKTRFENDPIFQGVNRLGELFVQCIDCFPENRQDYLNDKDSAKTCLQTYMKELKNELSKPNVLKAFLEKSLFNGNEVNSLAIKENEEFYVFWNEEVVNTIANNVQVENSRARIKGQVDAQKVVFKLRSNNITLGEIEMRNDSEVHYREVKFWLDKKLTFNLLKMQIDKAQTFKKRLVLYGKAINKLSNQLR